MELLAPTKRRACDGYYVRNMRSDLRTQTIREQAGTREGNELQGVHWRPSYGTIMCNELEGRPCIDDNPSRHCPNWLWSMVRLHHRVCLWSSQRRAVPILRHPGTMSLAVCSTGFSTRTQMGVGQSSAQRRPALVYSTERQAIVETICEGQTGVALFESVSRLRIHSTLRLLQGRPTRDRPGRT